MLSGKRLTPPLGARSFEERTALALERIADALETLVAPAPGMEPAPLDLDVEKTRATFGPKTITAP